MQVLDQDSSNLSKIIQESNYPFYYNSRYKYKTCKNAASTDYSNKKRHRRNSSNNKIKLKIFDENSEVELQYSLDQRLNSDLVHDVNKEYTPKRIMHLINKGSVELGIQRLVLVLALTPIEDKPQMTEALATVLAENGYTIFAKMLIDEGMSLINSGKFKDKFNRIVNYEYKVKFDKLSKKLHSSHPNEKTLNDDLERLSKKKHIGSIEESLRLEHQELKKLKLLKNKDYNDLKRSKVLYCRLIELGDFKIKTNKQIKRFVDEFIDNLNELPDFKYFIKIIKLRQFASILNFYELHLNDKSYMYLENKENYFIESFENYFLPLEKLKFLKALKDLNYNHDFNEFSEKLIENFISLKKLKKKLHANHLQFNKENGRLIITILVHLISNSVYLNNEKTLNKIYSLFYNMTTFKYLFTIDVKSNIINYQEFILTYKDKQLLTNISKSGVNYYAIQVKDGNSVIELILCHMTQLAKDMCDNDNDDNILNFQNYKNIEIIINNLESIIRIALIIGGYEYKLICLLRFFRNSIIEKYTKINENFRLTNYKHPSCVDFFDFPKTNHAGDSSDFLRFKHDCDEVLNSLYELKQNPIYSATDSKIKERRKNEKYFKNHQEDVCMLPKVFLKYNENDDGEEKYTSVVFSSRFMTDNEVANMSQDSDGALDTASPSYTTVQPLFKRKYRQNGETYVVDLRSVGDENNMENIDLKERAILEKIQLEDMFKRKDLVEEQISVGINLLNGITQRVLFTFLGQEYVNDYLQRFGFYECVF
ncbi:hypothetical protein B5S32_g3512 [[Candida] boidinii]|nr:hypothetical protein B5S32_g3512 [[Candida] boidinii]